MLCSHIVLSITSLRSGTAIKGVLLYVSNYVTKPALKTHAIFETVHSMFEKYSEMIRGLRHTERY
ncbi:hypothetical protein L208DRAFT_1396422 [Tricholoma matsutake]|nr:hypothetical protein L208DRAFT_1396422 [Tricholoma matsutake 945]